MRCPRCGNENPETNRFCGMCGATLLQTPTQIPEAGGPITSNPNRPVAPPTSATRPAAPANAEPPVIAGPSFLGLNQPVSNQRVASGTRSGAGHQQSIDPNAAQSSRNLDYLLEDDDGPKGGGAGKFVLILFALALAAGLGYLRWRNQGFGWLSSSNNGKPPAATQTSGGDSSSTAPITPVDGNASPPASTSPHAPAQPAGDAASPVPASPPTNANGTTPSNLAPTAGGAAGSNSASDSAAPPAANSPSPVPPSLVQPSSNQPSSASSSAAHSSAQSPATQPTADNDADGDSADAAPARNQPKPTPSDAKPNPAADIKPAKPADTVAEAQKYIYGKGVAQSCDRGMRILRPAAEHSNPKAMIEMGALYSAGLCAPRDLPTAYRWFAMALRKDPDNQAVQADLEKLWGEMTQPERQLAMKLSQ